MHHGRPPAAVAINDRFLAALALAGHTVLGFDVVMPLFSVIEDDFEFGDRAETTAGTPMIETPVARSVCWRKRRREVMECVFMLGLEDCRERTRFGRRRGGLQSLGPDSGLRGRPSQVFGHRRGGARRHSRGV